MVDEYAKAILIESVFDFGTFDVGEDDGHLQEISLAIDLAYLGIILLGYLALFGNQEKERIFYFYNIRKACNDIRRMRLRKIQAQKVSRHYLFLFHVFSLQFAQ